MTSVHNLDGIQIDDYGSPRVPTSANVGTSPVLPKAKDTRGRDRTTQNKYVNFFSHLDEKFYIDIRLIKSLFIKKSKVPITPTISFTI